MSISRLNCLPGLHPHPVKVCLTAQSLVDPSLGFFNKHIRPLIQLSAGTTRNYDGPKVVMSGDRLMKRLSLKQTTLRVHCRTVRFDKEGVSAISSLDPGLYEHFRRMAEAD